MAEVKWIKITTDIFDDEKILLIESMPDAYAIITVWFKLLCMAGKQNNSGVFVMGKIAYTDKMLATIFRMKESTVQLALHTFEQFGMIKIIDGVITIPNWEKHQNLDKLEQAKEQTRLRVAKHREKQRMLAGCNVTVTQGVTQSNADRVDKEEDLEGEKDNSLEKPKETRHKYGLYNNVLLSGSDIEKLQKEFPDYANRIERLSEYIASTGKSYKNHLATIRSWAKKDKQTKSYGRTAEEKNAGYCFSPNEDSLDDLF